MPYSIQRLPNEPIILYSAEVGTDISSEETDAMGETKALLESATEPVFLIVDLTNIKMGLDSMINTANRTTRFDGKLLHHPNLRESAFVTTDGMIKLALMGLTGAVFGNVKLSVHPTRQEALDYCHQKITETQQS